MSIFRASAFLIFLLTLFPPAHAETFVDEHSGIALPKIIAEMNVGEIRSGPGMDGYAHSYSYRNGPDLIQVFIMKANYPTASFWFPAAQKHFGKTLKAGIPKKHNDPKVVALGSSVENGIRQTYAFEKHYKSSSIAVVAFGDWIAFIMSTSKSLMPAEQEERMTKILDGMSETKIELVSRPAVLIEKCLSEPEFDLISSPENSEKLNPISIEMQTIGGVVAQIIDGEIHADAANGLLVSPTNYCKQESFTGKTFWFQKKVPDAFNHWILPFGITGMVVSGQLAPFPTKNDTNAMIGVTISSNFQRHNVAAFYQTRPDPVPTQLWAMAHLFGKPEIAYVEHNSNAVHLVDQSKKKVRD